jgi:Ca2+-binding RTX toxin-like protein
MAEKFDYFPHMPFPFGILEYWVYGSSSTVDLSTDTSNNHVSIRTGSSGSRLSYVMTVDDLQVDSDGNPISGFVTSIEYKYNKTTYAEISGIHVNLSGETDALQNSTEAFLPYLYDHITGNISEKGTDEANYFEVGRNGSATVSAGDGDDQLYIWHHKNVTFNGGAGSDTAIFSYAVGAFPEPKDGVSIDLQKGSGTNPYGGTLKFKNVENIEGTDNSDRILGNTDDNNLYGGTLGGSDVIKGRGGDDTIGVVISPADRGHQKIVADGGSGNNTLSCDVSFATDLNELNLADSSKNSGSFADVHIRNFAHYSFVDYLAGPAHASVVFVGTDENETVTTSQGNDTLDAGRGNDILSGGIGSNTFVFRSHFGKDTVLDFSQGTDNVLSFSHVVFSDYDDVMAHAHASGNDVVIKADHSDILQLSNVSLGNLQSDNFSFF